MAGQVGPIKDFLRAAAQKIGRTKGGMTKEQRKIALELLTHHKAAVVEAKQLLEGAHELHMSTMTKKPLKSNAVAATDITYGVPELYPGKTPRGTGEEVRKIASVTAHPGVYTRDVIQQTPMCEKDVDSVNIITSADAVTGSKAPVGTWAAAPEAVKEAVQWVSKDPPRGVVLEMKRESVVITLTPHASTLLDEASGKVAGQKTLDESGSPTVSVTSAAVKMCAENARLFRKTGEHNDVLGYCMTPDTVTAKVDGEALQIISGTGRRPRPDYDDTQAGAFAVSRNGSVWRAEISGRYEAEERTVRVARLTVEVYPRVDAPEAAFLVDADVFGVGNSQGYAFIAEVLKRKGMVLNLGGKELPLQAACLCTVPPSMSDGVVLHSNRRQSFVKSRISIDLEPGDVKDAVKKTWDVIEGPEGEKVGVSEYRAKTDMEGKTTLVFYRPRPDKIHGNRMTNITSLMGQLDAYTIAEAVTERVAGLAEDGEPKSFEWCVHEKYDIPGAPPDPPEGDDKTRWLLSYTWELVEKTHTPGADNPVPGEREVVMRELDRLAADEGDVGPLDDTLLDRFLGPRWSDDDSE